MDQEKRMMDRVVHNYGWIIIASKGTTKFVLDRGWGWGDIREISA
jgi:hypothetical protein